MNQISTMPSTADAMPARRSELSGLSIALAARRLAARGNAANNKPSITNTRPIATMNSVISAQPVLAQFRGYFGAEAAGGGLPGAGPASRALPDGSTKKRKKSESGLSSRR